MTRRITNEEKARYIKNRLTLFDIAMWHSGQASSHITRLMDSINAKAIQIQGCPGGTESLSVIVIK